MEKFIVIIGSTNGIGNKLIDKINYNKNNMILCNRNIELSKNQFPKCKNLYLDLSKYECLDEFINELNILLEKKHGYIDTLICNSGIKSKKKIIKFDNEELPETYVVNILSYQYIINKLIKLKYIIKNKTIMYFMTSIMHIFGTENILTDIPNKYYYNSKLALFYMSQYYNKNEYNNILINPGYVNTNIFGKNESTISKWFKNLLSINTNICSSLISQLINKEFTYDFTNIYIHNYIIYITLYKYNIIIEKLSKISYMFLILYDLTIKFNLKTKIIEKSASYSDIVIDINYKDNYTKFLHLNY